MLWIQHTERKQKGIDGREHNAGPRRRRRVTHREEALADGKLTRLSKAATELRARARVCGIETKRHHDTARLTCKMMPCWCHVVHVQAIRRHVHRLEHRQNRAIGSKKRQKGKRCSGQVYQLASAANFAVVSRRCPAAEHTPVIKAIMPSHLHDERRGQIVSQKSLAL